MTETVLDSLVVKIRADARELDSGLAATRAGLDGLNRFALQSSRTTRGLGESAAGTTLDLERATEAATRRMAGAFDRMARSGQLSFSSLKNAALSSLAEIASSYISAGLGSILQSGANQIASIFLPGRAGGGSVSPGRPYLVGERGPELFMPHGAGRIVTRAEAAAHGAPERAAPQINITVNAQGGAADARRSAAQMAMALRRALARSERTL